MKLMTDYRPDKKCEDPNCPYHGNVSVRGRAFTGRVIADRMAKTVTVEWDRRKYWPKYERYSKRRSRVKAHNPDCIDAEAGQIVRIAETRKLSKTKNFVVLQVVGEAKEDIVSALPTSEDKAEEQKKSTKESETEAKEDKTEAKEIPSRSTVESMTKDEIEAYAKKEFNIELSTNDLKKKMIDKLFEEIK